MKYNLPIIRTIADIEAKLSDIIIISKYNTYEKFDDLYYSIYYIACACFEIPKCISYKIKFKFYPEDDIIFELSIPKFILNLNAWRPLIELKEVQKYYHNQIEVLDQSYIVSIMMSDTLRVGLESKVLKTLNNYGISFERCSELLKVVIERYQELSLEFALLDKASIMTYESIFLNDYRRNEKIKELNNLKIDQNIQTADVSKLLHEKYKELIQELGNSKNIIWYISKAGKHIKEKQVEELFLSYGQIPDITGKVIPYTMQGNGFSTGYIDPTSYYIAASGARLSAIMNKEYMGKAGYLARNLVLMSRTLMLSSDTFDCGTKHLLEVEVSSNDFLRRLENKWFTEHLGEPIQIIQYNKHKHLIGKKIYIRSLLTCAGGDECCHVCYGNDSHLVMNMPGMGIFNTEVYSELLNQNILSTKHLLFADADKILFNNIFDKYFRYTAGEVYLKDKDEWEIDTNSDKLSIRIEECNMIPVNQNDMIDYNTFGNNIESPFYIYNSKTKEYETIEIGNYKSMFIESQSMKYFKLVSDKKEGKNYYNIPLDVLSGELEGKLLSIDIKNNGLTDNLFDIMNLLNKDGAKYENYSQLAQFFFETLIKAKLPCRHVQGEVILNRLIRDANNIYQRPDFRQFKNPDISILTLNKALMCTTDPTIALSYQELKRQFVGDALYEKDGSSFLAPMYTTEIDTSRFKAKHLTRLKNEGKETPNV